MSELAARPSDRADLPQLRNPPVPSAGEKTPLAILLLRRMNPLMMAILRSPLHGLLSRGLLVLEYRGRKSGLARQLPLSYVRHDGRVHLCTRTSVWVRNLGVGADVHAIIGGRRRAMHAQVLDPASTEALDALRAFVTANPGTGVKLYHVARGRDGKPVEDDLRREVHASRVVRLDETAG